MIYNIGMIYLGVGVGREISSGYPSVPRSIASLYSHLLEDYYVLLMYYV